MIHPCVPYRTPNLFVASLLLFFLSVSLLRRVRILIFFDSKTAATVQPRSGRFQVTPKVRRSAAGNFTTGAVSNFLSPIRSFFSLSAGIYFDKGELFVTTSYSPASQTIMVFSASGSTLRGFDIPTVFDGTDQQADAIVVDRKVRNNRRTDAKSSCCVV